MLNDDTTIEILSHMALEDLNTICMTNTTMQKLCHRKEFWRYKFDVDGFNKPSWVDLAHFTIYDYKWLNFIIKVDYLEQDYESLPNVSEVYIFTTTNLSLIYELLLKSGIKISNKQQELKHKLDTKTILSIKNEVVAMKRDGILLYSIQFHITIQGNFLVSQYFSCTRDQLNHFFYLCIQHHIIKLNKKYKLDNYSIF